MWSGSAAVKWRLISLVLLFLFPLLCVVLSLPFGGPFSNQIDLTLTSSKPGTCGLITGVCMDAYERGYDGYRACRPSFWVRTYGAQGSFSLIRSTKTATPSYAWHIHPTKQRILDCSWLKSLFPMYFYHTELAKWIDGALKAPNIYFSSLL